MKKIMKHQKRVKRSKVHLGSKIGHIAKKNAKFIQRGKTSENFHKKQKILEDKYREDARKGTLIFGGCDEGQEEDSEIEEEHFLETLEQPLKKDSKIEPYENEEIYNSSTELNVNNMALCDDLKMIAAYSECFSNSHNIPLFVRSENDPFVSHLDTELTTEYVEQMATSNLNTKRFSTFWPALRYLNIEIKNFNNSKDISSTEKLYRIDRKSMIKFEHNNHLKLIYVKDLIAQNTSYPLSTMQSELFLIMNNYHDLYFAERNFENSCDIQQMYCLHLLNHMLKTRSRIIHHNAKLNEIWGSKGAVANGIIPDSYRDQGLTRPKVLILLPNRNAAYNVVNILIKLLQGSNADASKSNGTIINYARFVSEYTGGELYFPKTNPKPEDYEKTFSGNTDDNFRVGLSLTKKCLKLYADFYASDVLIASPLGLRTVIGASGSKERDFDFLNSIEILIVDQAEMLIAQNWENVLHVLDHMHLPPQALRNTDFQRVRHWYLNGLARFYRQTLLFSTHDLPEFRALFNKCCNYEGKVRVTNPIEFGDIRNVIVPIAQIFQRIDISNYDSIYDQRFKYFIEEVLPKFRSPSFAHCMIYIPSYFDYIRLRNYFKAETISCVQICEYTKKPKIARARDMFFHSGVHFLLYSERSHFFRRTRIKGIRHLIFYQLPVFPHFYSEMINLMHNINQNNRDGLQSSMSITALYTKYDMIQLSAIVGNKVATELLKSTKSMHSFTSE